MSYEIDRLADAFYDEHWSYIQHITGKLPKNHLEAEQIINEYTNKNYNVKAIKEETK